MLPHTDNADAQSADLKEYTDWYRCAMLLYTAWTQRVAALGINKGNALWSGGRLLYFVVILTQHKVKKAACNWREDWCAKCPPPFSLLPPFGIWRSGIPQRERRLILSTPRDRACFSHRVIWDFQRGSGGWGRRRYCAAVVGLVLVEMTGWWCGDR